MHSNIKRFGLLFIFLGLLFGVETYLNYYFLYKLWPLFITILGAGFVGIFYKREKREAIYLGIGSYLIAFSFLALYCNFFSWVHLSFLWPLFIFFFALSFLSIYFLFAKHIIFLFAFLFFLSISLLFFVVFSISGKLWWLIFIFIGSSILILDKRSKI
ncbi:MAG TPA: hypothetical protein PLD27_04935 [bacterium]|nr:hypothetical protein [bacterium]HOL47722.1 hypothetical protein [bacterium]HPQ18060.1 hypothetical protein [bacterium]